jgi:hypothetical protein
MNRKNSKTIQVVVSGLIAGLILNIGAIRPAQAQLMFTLDPTNIGTLSGVNVTTAFAATLTNLYDQPLYLNGDFATVDAPLNIDDTPFIDTFVLPADANGNLLDQPTLAANGGSITVDIFDVAVPDFTQNGIYNGVFAIEHGFAPGDLTNTTAANFQVQVSPSGAAITPEPGISALLTGYGIAAMLCLRRRRTMFRRV